jgi:glycosyltransferase involved in cell wall biosynthesis
MGKEISKSVLIIIPCYNEAENVSRLNNELQKLEIENCSVLPLFINDASTDNTKDKLAEIGAVFLDNAVNLGIGGTVQLGFMYAYRNNFDIAVQMDGDGQHPPSELKKLIQPLFEHQTDVTIGSRFIHEQGFKSTYMRRVGIHFFSRLNKLLVRVEIKDPTSGYRAYNRKAMEELIKYYPDEYPEPEAIIYLAHKKIKMLEVSVRMNERLGGKSSIRYFTTFYYMAKVTLNSLILHFKMKFNG